MKFETEHFDDIIRQLQRHPSDKATAAAIIYVGIKIAGAITWSAGSIREAIEELGQLIEDSSVDNSYLVGLDPNLMNVVDKLNSIDGGLKDIYLALKGKANE